VEAASELPSSFSSLPLEEFKLCFSKQKENEVLSSLFEKSKEARDKTLIYKNRNRNKLVLQSLGYDAGKNKNRIGYPHVQCLGYF
jgi:hypothetical protein